MSEGSCHNGHLSEFASRALKLRGAPRTGDCPAWRVSESLGERTEENPEHVALVKQGVERWNEWRNNAPISPDLREADLRWNDLSGVNFREANLRGADLGRRAIAATSAGAARSRQVVLPGPGESESQGGGGARSLS